MSYPRRLDDAALAAARREYETGPVSTRRLADKYGLSKSALAEWVQRERWQKYRSPVEFARHLERRVQKKARVIEEAAVAGGLAGCLKIAAGADLSANQNPDPDATLGNPGRGSRHEPADVQASCRDARENPELRPVRRPRDRPARPIPASLAAVAEPQDSKPGKPSETPNAAKVVRFPTGEEQAAKPDTWALPARRKAEGAQRKLDLAALRGELLAQQLESLEKHQQRLEDYGHLIDLVVAPREHLDLDGLSEAECEARISAVRKQALPVLLPSKRDTLAGAMKTMTSTLLATAQLKLKVADLARAAIRSTDGDLQLAELTTAELCKVQEAMELVERRRPRAHQPPMPPPPEPIDDLLGD